MATRKTTEVAADQGSVDVDLAVVAARKILPDPPAWLVHAIRIVALPALRREITGYGYYPTRKELRPKIKATTGTIETLILNLRDAGVWSQIVSNSPAGSASRARLERVADVVLNELPYVLEALGQAADNMPEGKGARHAVLHPKAPAPAIMCAAFVTILWAEVDGEVPGAHTKRLWKACVEMWKASGGRRLDRAGGAGWRNHLSRVGAIPPALLDRYKRRIRNVRAIAEAGHLGAVLTYA